MNFVLPTVGEFYIGDVVLHVRPSSVYPDSAYTNQVIRVAQTYRNYPINLDYVITFHCSDDVMVPHDKTEKFNLVGEEPKLYTIMFKIAGEVWHKWTFETEAERDKNWHDLITKGI